MDLDTMEDKLGEATDEETTDESIDWSSYSSSDEEMWRWPLHDIGRKVACGTGMFMFGTRHDKYLNWEDYMVPNESGEEWVHRKLAHSTSCYKMFRMSPIMFHRLHDVLVQSYGLASSTKSGSMEALGMFLWILGGGHSVRTAEDRLERSVSTVHNNFTKVLKCVVKLAAHILKPFDPQFSTIHPRLQSPRFQPFFNNCIGAIDGTHIPCVVSSDKLVQYMCRKGKTTQNVMAICDFDMRFTFVLAGWPGSVDDMRVFNDATTRWSHKYPHPPAGKFYLVDSGYPNQPGYLAPYKQTKYYLAEFREGPALQGKQEIFNFNHSALRNIIERSFGVLKMKWRILLGIPSYPPRRQTEIIYACFALHNFIRSSGIVDRDFDICDRDDHFVGPQASVQELGSRPVSDTSSWMNDYREWIANGLLNRQ